MRLGEDAAGEYCRPKVAIVSDVMLFRDGLRSGLDQIGELDIIGAVDPAAALDLAARTGLEFVILDASRRRAIAHARALRAVRPGLKIVAFGIAGQQDILTAAEAGIVAFVGPDGDIAEINRAVLMARSGECYCPPRLTACLIGHIASLAQRATQIDANCLTHREQQVASMVGEGLSNKQIALQLRISAATVKNHVHNILDKLNLPNRSAVGSKVDLQPVGDNRFDTVS